MYIKDIDIITARNAQLETTSSMTQDITTLFAKEGMIIKRDWRKIIFVAYAQDINF